MDGWMEKKIGSVPEEIQECGFGSIDSFDYSMKNRGAID